MTPDDLDAIEKRADSIVYGDVSLGDVASLVHDVLELCRAEVADVMEERNALLKENARLNKELAESFAAQTRLIEARIAAPASREPRPPALTREICKNCGRHNVVGFHVPDLLWEQVVPAEHREKVLCLWCFDEFAHEKGIEWESAMGTFWPVSAASMDRLNREMAESEARVEGAATSVSPPGEPWAWAARQGESVILFHGKPKDFPEAVPLFPAPGRQP